MTADEIRKMVERQQSVMPPPNVKVVPYEVAAAVFRAGWLGEIAAQLAELNELLRNVADAVLPLKR